MIHVRYLALAVSACSLLAQPVSSYKYTVKGDEKTVEITNVNYEELDSGLVLRMTTHLKHFVGEKGLKASTTTEAWKLGVDLKTKPLYSVTVEGTETRTVDGALFAVSRGLDETDWWSIYKIGNGAHLFDTYVPLSPPATLNVVIPIAGDDLDLPHAQLPPHLHIAAWNASPTEVVSGVETRHDRSRRSRFY